MLLPHVQEIVLCPFPDFPPSSSQLQSLLNGVPSLEELTLSGCAWERLHRFLTALGVYDNSEEITVPNLHSLTLLHYDYQLDTLPIILLLNRRAEMGHPIDRLSIEGCRVRHQEQLSEFISDIRNLYYAPTSKRPEEIILEEMWLMINSAGPVLHSDV